MDCKVTSLTKRWHCAGATIMEQIMAHVGGVILMAAVMAFAMFNTRSFAILSNNIDTDQANRIAIDRMTKDIRQANRMTTYATNSVTFEDWNGEPLSFTFDAARKQLTRKKGTQPASVLLTDLDLMTFSMMQRNIIEGSYDYFPADDLATCKVVGIFWVSSKSILGKRSSVSGGQSTRVVIRKQ